jgi:hypothetical protein
MADDEWRDEVPIYPRWEVQVGSFTLPDATEPIPARAAVSVSATERKHLADQLVIPPPVDRSGRNDAPGDMLTNLARWITSFDEDVSSSTVPNTELASDRACCTPHETLAGLQLRR